MHEAVAWLDGILYETEDRKNVSYSYRYIPENPPGSGGNLADTSGVLQALKTKGVQNAIMDTFPTGGEPHEVEWATIAEPNPADDTDSSRLAVGEQAQGAAIFAREEGIWVGGDKAERGDLRDYRPLRAATLGSPNATASDDRLRPSRARLERLRRARVPCTTKAWRREKL